MNAVRSVEGRQKREEALPNVERRSGYSLRLRRFDWTCIVLLWLIVAGSALGVGAVFVPVLAVISIVASVVVVLCWRQGYTSFRGLPLAALCLAAISLLQAIPMPLAWLETIAPYNAEVWVRALRPLDLPAPRWVPLSLDPGATLVEVLKWCTYAATLFAASVVRRTAGKRVLLFLVFSSAVLVGLVSLGHSLIGAEELFGVYRPRFAWQIAPLLNPNNLAGYLSLGSFAGLGLLLDRKTRTRSYRWLLGLAVSGLICLVVLSGSRAGLAALGLGLFILALVTVVGRARDTQKSPLPRLAPLAATVGGAAVLGAFAIRPTMVHELLGQGLQKLDLFKWTLPMIEDHRWFGVGRGAFETAFQPYRLGGGNAVFTHAENFVIQWVAEWGVPVAGIALVTFAWLLWPRNNKKFDPIITCAYVGLVALLIQNLFDLALEVPAVSIAVSVVCGGLIDSGKRQTEPEARSATIPLRGRFSILFVVLQLAGLIGSLVLGRNTAISDRDLLHQAYDAVRRRETGAEARFQETLRATISRHPGDGYLPLMAAVAAQATNQPALRWLSRSLERDPMNGRTHLALARELGKHGARSQALLELRLAAECEAALVPSTAPLALRWARTLSDLLQAVPEGAPGADMLVTLARQTDATWKDELLREAVRRNPENVDAHLDLGMWLAQQILSNDPACAARRQADCAREVDAHVEALHRLWPGAQWVRLKATLLAALGKPDEALSLLHQACPGTIDQRICFAVALRIASTSGSSPMLSETITHYLGSCAGPQECSSSEIDVGDILAAKEQWGSALPHYTRAAQVLRTAGAWLRVAEVAQRAGAYAQARNAVDRARNDPEHAVPAIQNRLHAIEEQSTARQLRQDPGGAR